MVPIIVLVQHVGFANVIVAILQLSMVIPSEEGFRVPVGAQSSSILLIYPVINSGDSSLLKEPPTIAITKPAGCANATVGKQKLLDVKNY